MNATAAFVSIVGTVVFASEKVSLECFSEDNCRNRLRPRFNVGIIILFNFCRICFDFSGTNRPFVELGHVLEYHLETAREMARHPSVHSYQFGLSAIS